MSDTKQTVRRYFFDSEFSENIHEDISRDLYNIDFISIGIVSEDGEYYYAEHDDFDEEAAAKNDFLAEHVLPKLGPVSLRKDVKTIGRDVKDFIRPAQNLEFYARNPAYDVVTLCRLFGSMQKMKADLTQKGVLRFTFRDINEFKFDPDINWNKLPRKDESKAHHSGYDAKFERELYLHIKQLKRGTGPS